MRGVENNMSLMVVTLMRVDSPVICRWVYCKKPLRITSVELGERGSKFQFTVDKAQLVIGKVMGSGAAKKQEFYIDFFD